MSVTLARECSQRTGGLAVQGSDGVIRTEALESASGVDDQLMTAIARLFKEASAVPQDLSLVGVSIGPGGFTGLRVAMATAKTLAFVTGCQLAAVPTAHVVAASLPSPHKAVGVLLSERRGTAWCTCISASGEPMGTPGLVDTHSLAERVDGCEILVGDLHIQETFRDGIHTSGLPVRDLPANPAACLKLAQAFAERGQTVGIHQLEPLYPRPPEAVRLFDAR